MKPDVVLRTRLPSITKESHIDIIVEFTKPIFRFEASMVEVLGGRMIRQVHMEFLQTFAYAVESNLYVICLPYNIAKIFILFITG